MNSTRHLLCLALLAPGVWAADTATPPKLNLGNLAGVPTPLEEYGLSIGDITVTRVINPLGQLSAGSPIMLSRQLKTITNPWTELTPGTAVIVGGKKAVIMQIDPDRPPENQQRDLEVTIIAKEIAGATNTLRLKQKFLYLNSAESADTREDTVKEVNNNLRVGSHLILENNLRVIVTKRSFRHEPEDSTSNNHLKLTLKYRELVSGGGILTGRPSPASDVGYFIPAWELKKENPPKVLANKTVQLVTWELIDPPTRRKLTVLHRARGTIQKISLKDDKHVEVMARFHHNGHSHIRAFQWTLRKTSLKGRSWHLEPGADGFMDLFYINDTNIKFKVTPEVLVKANENALKSFQQHKNIDVSPLTPGNVDPETLQIHIKNLMKIIDEDASQTLKIDAKRQAVIYLARFFEHSALAHQALANEYLTRAEFQIQRARNLERHAWANRQKLNLVRAALLKDGAPLPDLSQPEPGRSEDLDVKSKTILDLETEIAKFKTAIQSWEAPSLQVEHGALLRQLAEQQAHAGRIRVKAQALRLQAEHPKTGLQKKVREEYMKSLQFWTEYIHRTEGLAGDRLAEPGAGSNVLPPDPYIPEILLRQAWIYRQLGQPERATDRFHDVLKSATVQRIENLTRFGRIYLVARSQIANTYARDARNHEDHDEAIDKFEVLLKPAMKNPPEEQEELNTNQLQLKLLRTLFRVNEDARAQLRLLQLRRSKLQTEKINGTEAEDFDVFVVPKLEKIQAEINLINQRREVYWKKMAQHATAFIQRYGESGAARPHQHSGEVMYYQIIAHKALGNHEHVQRELEVLLKSESTPEEQRQVWANTRVRVVTDIANLLFHNGAQLMKTDPTSQPARESLEGALSYYRWALLHDQTYRSQILIRQQIGFCLERLGRTVAARDTYDRLVKLCDMHPVDVKNNPAVRVTRALTQFRLQNLNHQINQQEKTRIP
jgi:tetratricopeptide (TPR) repeat protein